MIFRYSCGPLSAPGNLSEWLPAQASLDGPPSHLRPSPAPLSVPLFVWSESVSLFPFFSRSSFFPSFLGEFPMPERNHAATALDENATPTDVNPTVATSVKPHIGPIANRAKSVQALRHLLPLLSRSLRRATMNGHKCTPFHLALTHSLRVTYGPTVEQSSRKEVKPAAQNKTDRGKTLNAGPGNFPLFPTQTRSPKHD